MRELLYFTIVVFGMYITHILLSMKRIRNPQTFLPKKESICRQILEEVYGLPFPNCRPDWLKNVTGHNLELDCYNEVLKIALEYNGEQHYLFPNFTNCSYRQFVAQQQRDALKKKLCENRGVKLIIVPYTVETKDLKSFILKAL